MEALSGYLSNVFALRDPIATPRELDSAPREPAVAIQSKWSCPNNGCNKKYEPNQRKRIRAHRRRCKYANSPMAGDSAGAVSSVHPRSLAGGSSGGAASGGADRPAEPSGHRKRGRNPSDWNAYVAWAGKHARHPSGKARTLAEIGALRRRDNDATKRRKVQMGRVLIANRERRNGHRQPIASPPTEKLSSREMGGLRRRLGSIQKKLYSGGVAVFTVMLVGKNLELVCPPGPSYGERLRKCMTPALRLAAAMSDVAADESRSLRPQSSSARTGGSQPLSRHALVRALEEKVRGCGGTWPLTLRDAVGQYKAWPTMVPQKKSMRAYNKGELRELLKVEDWSRGPTSSHRYVGVIRGAAEELAGRESAELRGLGESVLRILRDRARAVAGPAQ